ncbi:MAG: prepilin-type N-terminal cleavage/methylation domain-containing protein [Candidatus Omnitrophica bacterium]|jgi:type II secretory pathway pseudopilin PulG|nr:prepilin-type N-terminal cleavage/methylation domain-containing protein [Candidatus Omnitrophota bacterium]
MKKGFTLVEIMIVVAIIALLAAISIPNILRQRLNANETAAQSTLGTISAVEQSYRSVNPLYATLAQLIAAVPPYIDATVDDVGGKQGYVFADAQAAPDANTFCVSAVPVTANQTGTRSFCVADDGVIRVQAAGGAIASRAACLLLPPTS